MRGGVDVKDTRKRLHDFMRESGFTVVRMGKHVLWSDGEIKITTAMTPSDSRALENVKALVRKAREDARSQHYQENKTESLESALAFLRGE